MRSITEITTNQKAEEYWHKKSLEAEEISDYMHVVNIYPDVTYQKFRGFGGAFTESAAYNYMRMGEKNRKSIIRDYFSEDGLRYNMGRVPINSCDFSLGNYSYVEEGDQELKTFCIAHDAKEMIPMIQDAQAEAGKKLKLLASPWSPPAFMKTNGEMNYGGRLKKTYYEAWAEYFVKFIEEYRKMGIHIEYVTVQNEPHSAQTWDSCVYSAKEEQIFVQEYLGPALQAAGLSEVQIFIWDHNKDEAYQRVKKVLADGNKEQYIKGAAVHWYTGDHFEAIELIKKQYPALEVFFTEGCVEYSRFSEKKEIEKAEMYAHDILGNLNAGISASIDWNLLLDMSGGPNHAENYCEAPIMCDINQDLYKKQLSYFYIGHFSRYIRPGAVRIGVTRYTDQIEAAAFLNPAGERVVILLNRTEAPVPVCIKEGKTGTEAVLPPHSVKTFCCM